MVGSSAPLWGVLSLRGVCKGKKVEEKKEDEKEKKDAKKKEEKRKRAANYKMYIYITVVAHVCPRIFLRRTIRLQHPFNRRGLSSEVRLRHGRGFSNNNFRGWPVVIIMRHRNVRTSA